MDKRLDSQGVFVDQPEPIVVYRDLVKEAIERAVPRVNSVSVDMVNHPPHYKQGGIETIDFIEAKQLNYNLGNVVKYITRSELKGNKKQDLEKAAWYLAREIS